MDDSTSPSAPAPKRGLKLPAGVAAVLVLLAIGAGGWFVWTQLRPTPVADLSQYEPIDGPAARARTRIGGPAQRPDQVITRADGGGEVNVTGARARFNVDAKAPGGMRLELQYTDRFQSPEDWQAIRARFNAITSADQAKNAGLKPEQIEQLKTIAYPREMVGADAGRAELLGLWSRYRTASESEREGMKKPLCDALRKTAADSLTPTIASVKQTADEVRKILTPEQIAALRGNARRGA